MEVKHKSVNRISQTPEWACKLIGEAFKYGISITQIAKEAGYTRFWVARVLRGEPATDTTKSRITEAFERIKGRIEANEL